ncbi:CrcB family protein [Paenibacillus oenotherae]|uniref:Fluoride-specific ion channel FluC n=1 Tax=Paenibacillus oenotherae TaxID=1435645 RepID=A0ABS7D3T4_9BACL|nr:CrcB family protein [Paenibacillus oenotherae]MBW7474222.1 CrcB family protein [Paenibacillus oenotherae]
MMMLMVALGGALGASARYGIGLYMAHIGRKPYWGTLFINAVGALLLGMIAGWGWNDRYSALYHFAGIGFLGGFTTFSTLSVQLAGMLSQRKYGEGLLYLALTLGLGLALASIGYIMTQ